MKKLILLLASLALVGCAVRYPVSGKKAVGFLEPKMKDVDVPAVAQATSKNNQTFFFMNAASSVMPSSDLALGGESEMSATTAVKLFSAGMDAGRSGAEAIADTLAKKNREVFTVVVTGDSEDVKEIARYVTMSKLIPGTNVVEAFSSTSITGDVQAVDFDALNDLAGKLSGSIGQAEQLAGLLETLGVESDTVDDLIGDLLDDADDDTSAEDPPKEEDDSTDDDSSGSVALPPGASFSNLIKESTNHDGTPSGRGAVVLINAKYLKQIESVTVGGVSFVQSTDFTKLPNGAREHWRNSAKAVQFNGKEILVKLKSGRVLRGRISGSGGGKFRGSFQLSKSVDRPDVPAIVGEQMHISLNGRRLTISPDLKITRISGWSINPRGTTEIAGRIGGPFLTGWTLPAGDEVFFQMETVKKGRLYHIFTRNGKLRRYQYFVGGDRSLAAWNHKLHTYREDWWRHWGTTQPKNVGKYEYLKVNG